MLKSFQMPHTCEGFDSVEFYYPEEKYKSLYGNYLDYPNTCMDYNQNHPFHPETLGEHALEVYKHVFEKCPDDINLTQAALLHDVGKPFCESVDPNTGISHYFNHGNVSSYMSMFFEGIQEHSDVGALIAYHMDMFKWRASEKS